MIKGPSTMTAADATRMATFIRTKVYPFLTHREVELVGELIVFAETANALTDKQVALWNKIIERANTRRLERR